jgi:hypothetical protein
MRIRIPGLTVLFVLCGAAIFAGTIPKPSITPIQAELIGDVQARLTKVGASVFARVTIEWRGTDCVLRNGAILQAQVISVIPHTKTVKGSELGLVFSKAQCGEPKMSDFELLLTAVSAPPENMDLGILSDPVPFKTTPGGLQGNLSNYHASQGVTWPLEAGINQKRTVPPMQIGDVFGIRGLKLSVGAGPDNKSTVLMNKDHDVSLDRHTVLLLIPLRGVFPGVVASAGTSQQAFGGASTPSNVTASNTVAPAPATVVPAPAPPPVDDIELCEPPQCNTALPPGDASDLGKATGSISIGVLGYSARPQRAMDSFDHDEALAYLGPRELLVAFNPHLLAPRHTLGRSGLTVRVIRAALVDTETHRVTHTVEWEIPDNRQYLWPLSEGRVLVHAGSELRVYGEGLKVQNRVSLDGPLAYVRVTPDGSFIALGVIRERHSLELHAQLSESLNGDPEEDVEVLVLNRDFEVIAQSTTRSGLMPPALLNEGQAALLAQPNMRYRISMLPWDKHAWTFARFNSSCTPEISSIAPDLIFLASCDKDSEEPEYSVLRPNGKLMLKSVPKPFEFGYAAEGSANREAFVVKIVRSSRPVPWGAPFSAGDFTAEELRVYRAADGKSLLRVVVGSPSSSSDGFALAPDGSQLAVLTRDQIAVYPVPRR